MKIFDLYPAIDIKHGRCVRLLHGKTEKETIYNTNPLNQVEHFIKMGCKWVHIVDIDGAFAGKPINEKCVYQIKSSSKCNIQVGGGIRSIKAIENYIDNSVDRIILGTIALQNPGFVIEVCKKFPNKIAVGIDSKNDLVATNGWVKNSKIKTEELVKKFEDVGVSVIIITDINKDGLLQGMNFELIKKITSRTSSKIIASGGVSNLEDLRKLKRIKNENLEGVISGKAMYEDKFSIKEALKVRG